MWAGWPRHGQRVGHELWVLTVDQIRQDHGAHRQLFSLYSGAKEMVGSHGKVF